MDLELVLRRAVELGASDVHLKVERPPIVRRDGILGELEGEMTSPSGPRARPRTGLLPKRRSGCRPFLETGELDSAYAPPGLPRFRVNGFRQRGVDLSRVPRDPAARCPTSRSSRCLSASGASPRSTAASSSSPARPARARRRRSRRSSTTSTARGGSTSSRSRIRSRSSTPTAAASSTSARSASTPRPSRRHSAAACARTRT